MTTSVPTYPGLGLYKIGKLVQLGGYGKAKARVARHDYESNNDYELTCAQIVVREVLASI